MVNKQYEDGNKIPGMKVVVDLKASPQSKQ